MIGRWSIWKRFPDAFHGEHIKAPIGPGVYEVCHTTSGGQVAFGYAANVAQALSNILLAAPRGRAIRSASWKLSPPRRVSPPSS